MKWTSEMEAALERHLIDGLSYSQISALLKRASAPAKSAKRAVAPSQPVPKPDFIGLPLHEIEPGQCKWPVNDSSTPDGHLFCGLPHDKTALQPYCDYHMAMNISRDPCKHLSMIERRNRARRKTND